MSIQFPWSWCASIAVKTSAAQAYRFMADGAKQTNWAMGSWNRKALGAGLFVGQSLFDGSDLYVKPVGHEQLLLVDYYCGTRPDGLSWQVEARIIPGTAVGLGPEQCLINMTTWRTGSTDREEWERQQHVWETEIHLIKGLLEREAPSAGP